MSREVESFKRFIYGSIDSIVGYLDGLDEAELNWRPPAPETNSLYAIASHVLGNAEENILGTLCGRPYHRDHPAEFAAKAPTPEPVREQWRALKARIDEALAALPDSELDRERRHPRRGLLTGREVLIVVARHAAEHWGQVQLTRDLVRARNQ
jgi:hypothetical protein